MPATKVKLTDHRCAICRRKLPSEQWVFSRHTGNRYCLPGTKCNPSDRKEQDDQ